MNDAVNVSLTPGQRRANQIKLLILWLVPLGLMAAAGLTYYLVQTGQMSIGSKNNGVLIRPPIQMVELLKNNPVALKTNSDGKPVSIFSGKWTLVVHAAGQCDQDCRDALYLTRQLHIRLDKEANRVQRVYMFDADGDLQQAGLDGEFKAFIEREHHYLKTLPVSRDSIKVLDAATTSQSGEAANFLIVDPQGWAMMYYLDEHGGNAVLADIKHLLKFSRESR